MALVLADRVRENSTTTGTGSALLSGAYSGFQSFANTIGNGNTTYYAISNLSIGEWEVGIGTYTLSGNSLSRDTVFASSNSGGLVNFSTGTKDVICTQPAERAVYLDSSLNATIPGLTVSNLTASQAVFTNSSKSLVSNTITGTGNVVMSTSPTLVTPALGTPASVVLTNATGLPIASGVSGLGAGVATFLATPNSTNLRSVVTDETGTGSLVFATSPALVTPALGTPSALVGTNITGTASGLTAGTVTTNANLTGAVTSVGNATSLGSFTSLQLLTALTNETGSGSAVFATSPTLVTPLLGTPTSGVMTNVTGLPLTTGVTGTLPVANGGTSATTAAAALVALGVQTSTTGSEIVSTGTTAQRDVTPAAGYFRFNTTNVQFEGYDGTVWGAVGGGASGGSGNPIMYENDSVVSVSYTITTGKNASSTGPLTINSGISVTVPSGSTWVVL